jgi:SNF2 family DNA or RNA helicase
MMYSTFRHSGVTEDKSLQIAEWKGPFGSPQKRAFVLPKKFRSYSRDGTLWINHILKHGFHRLIANDIDLAKTLQVLTSIPKMTLSEETIVICPANVCYVGKSEAERLFVQRHVQIFSASANLDDANVHICVVNYSQMRRHETIIA